jgi:hypothetical protein
MSSSHVSKTHEISYSESHSELAGQQKLTRPQQRRACSEWVTMGENGYLPSLGAKWL